MRQCDVLVIGAGIVGLSVADEVKRRRPQWSVTVIEKEPHVGFHASGRNSGVLHAGFYYPADSLKARFCKEGNQWWQTFCRERNLPLNRCGKLVVAVTEAEQAGLEELKRRGDRNGVPLEWVDEKQTAEIDPNARTVGRALFSPSTATVDPVAVCQSLYRDLKAVGVDFYFDSPYREQKNQVVSAGKEQFAAGYVINAAGMYADRIAKDFGFGTKYTMIPFKGLYLKYVKNPEAVRTNIYPVPNLKNPFLGVHFTKMFDGGVKIGPTAVPAFWRENYDGWSRFKADEFREILYHEAQLFRSNAFHFRSLAWEEMKKYNRKHLIRLASQLVHHLDGEGFAPVVKPGIRAQLLNRENLELVQDFVIEEDRRSLHVLNAVSPAFTCARPFARAIVDRMESERREE